MNDVINSYHFKLSLLLSLPIWLQTLLILKNKSEPNVIHTQLWDVLSPPERDVSGQAESVCHSLPVLLLPSGTTLTEIKELKDRGVNSTGSGGGGAGGWVKKMKGLVVTGQSQGWKVQHRKYSQWYCTMHGARWVLEIPRGPLSKAYDCLTTMLYTWNYYKIISLRSNCDWKTFLNFLKILKKHRLWPCPWVEVTDLGRAWSCHDYLCDFGQVT